MHAKLSTVPGNSCWLQIVSSSLQCTTPHKTLRFASNNPPIRIHARSRFCRNRDAPIHLHTALPLVETFYFPPPNSAHGVSACLHGTQTLLQKETKDQRFNMQLPFMRFIFVTQAAGDGEVTVNVSPRRIYPHSAMRRSIS